MTVIFERDHLGTRFIGYNDGLSFLSPDRTLQQRIYLQEDNTLNIGGSGSASSLLTETAANGLYVRLDGKNWASWTPDAGIQSIVGSFNLAGAAYEYKINGSHALSIPGTGNLLAGAGAGAVLAAGGTKNVLLGYGTGAALTDQDENTVIGYNAATAADLDYSTVIGANAYAGAGTMSASVFIANDAGGIGAISNSVVMGWAATGTLGAGEGTTGSVIIGFQAAGSGNIDSNSNVLIGYQAGMDISTGGSNTAVGETAAHELKTGTHNTVMGVEAAYYIQGGDYNTAIGYLAGQYLNDANYGTFVGAYAGEMFRSGGGTAADYNVAMGYGAAQWWDYGQSNVVIGAEAGGATIGGDNTLNRNTVIGADAGFDLDDGADDNALFGYRAGYNVTTGDANTYIGNQAGFTSTTAGGGVFLGFQSGYFETAANKLFIDNAQRANEADARVKALVYGVFAAATADQYLTFNSNVTVTEVLQVDNEGLHIFDTGGDHDLIIKVGSNLDADYIFTITTGNAARTLDMGGNLTIGAATSITGGGTIALGGFTLTVPATGTAALLATANVFTAAQTVRVAGTQLTLGHDAADYATIAVNATGATTIATVDSDGALAHIILNPNGFVIANTKIAFTQVDGNEYIDSLNDGYLDYGASHRHRFHAPILIDKSSPTALIVEQDGVHDDVLVVNTTNGMVFVGKAAPFLSGAQGRLYIAGDWTGASDGQFQITGHTNDLKRLRIGIDTTNDIGVIQSTILGTGNITFALNPGGGNVLVGTSTDNGQQLQVYKVGTQLGLYGGAADYATFAVAADGAMTITTVDADAALADINLVPDGHVGIKTAAPTAELHLPGSAAGAAGTGPLKFTAGTILASPEAGVIEFVGGRMYVTNVASQRAVDRTSDVAVATVTVANTAVETTMWTAPMAANSLVAGNVFRFHADGEVTNNGNHADNDITIRVNVGGNEVVSLKPVTKALTDVHWHIDANATQRTIGNPGARAVHVHLVIGDVDEQWFLAVANINTTANMDVTVTAEWATAHANNTISLYQGYMSYRN